MRRVAGVPGFDVLLRLELTPDRLAGFSTVHGFPAGALAAITGIDVRGYALPKDAAPADIAELIRDLRRLTSAQLRQVCRDAEAMRQALSRVEAQASLISGSR